MSDLSDPEPLTLYYYICSNIGKAWNFFRQVGAGKRLLLFLERQFGCLEINAFNKLQQDSQEIILLISNQSMLNSFLIHTGFS